MATLTEYLTDLRNILKDPYNNFYTTQQMTLWINKARKQVARDAQCVRYMPAPYAGVTSYAVATPGSGYTTATATVSAPDAVGGSLFPTATATVQVSGGLVTGLTIVDPGDGYVNTPTVTIDGDGVGATATATLGPRLTTAVGKEKYDFAAANAIVAHYRPDISEIIGVMSVAVSWGTMKPMLGWCAWSSMQAYLRAYNWGYTSWPQSWSQYGQGAGGTVYIWPPASEVSQMEWDCFCHPAALSSTQTVDAIPQPWPEAVAYYAAYLGYLDAQRTQDATSMLQFYKKVMDEFRVAVSPPMSPSMY